MIRRFIFPSVVLLAGILFGIGLDLVQGTAVYMAKPVSCVSDPIDRLPEGRGIGERKEGRA